MKITKQTAYRHTVAQRAMRMGGDRGMGKG